MKWAELVIHLFDFGWRGSIGIKKAIFSTIKTNLKKTITKCTITYRGIRRGTACVVGKTYITCRAAMGTRGKWLLDSHNKIILDYLSWQRAAGHTTETLTATKKEHFINSDLFFEGTKTLSIDSIPWRDPTEHPVWSSVIQMFTRLALEKEADSLRDTNPFSENSPQIFLECLPFMIAVMDISAQLAAMPLSF